MNMNLKEAVYQGVRRENEKRDEAFKASRANVESNVLYATQMSNCARRWVFEQLQEYEHRYRPEKFSDQVLLVFADGHATEDTLVKALSKSELRVVGTQESVTMDLPGTDYTVRGRTDLSIDFGAEHGIQPVEIKSMNVRNFALALTFGPKTEHLLQISYYVYAQKATGGRLLYKEKNSGEMQEFLITAEDACARTEYNFSLWQRAVQDFGSLNPIPLAGMHPQELTFPDDCRYCKHTVACRKATMYESATDESLPWDE